jgi:transposase
MGLGLRHRQRLWALYRREGLAGYLEYRCRGCAGQLTTAQQAQPEERLRGDEGDSLKQACAYAEREFGARYTVSGVSWRFRR